MTKGQTPESYTLLLREVQGKAGGLPERQISYRKLRFF